MSIHFSSAKDEWSTPQWLFDALNAEFHFVLDAAASVDNSRCSHYFTKADSALERDWTDGPWMPVAAAGGAS